MRLSILALVPAAALALASVAIPVAPAQAGCGCDHPPPGYAPVMPPFGSPGKTLRLNAPSEAPFVPGTAYVVEIGGAGTVVVAEHETHLFADVPEGAQPGPAAVKIVGPNDTHEYQPRDFTVMAPAPMVPEENGLFARTSFEAAVTEDGTVLIPFNLTEVAAATQFMVILRGMPLQFGQDDVVFYNADGVDLTLFTLAVDNASERQWGSYFGWEVEQDRGLRGTIYDNKIVRSLFADRSDELTYWRHEFQTYKDAHLPGGTHEVGEDGYHTQTGTLHIDHDHLVLAVSGKLRDPNQDPSEWESPAPGKKTVDVFVLMLQAPVPLEPEMMAGQASGSIAWNLFSHMISERPTTYRRRHHDDDDD